MTRNIVLSVINAKYVHAASAPWCLAAGVKAYAPEFWDCLRILDFNGKQSPEAMLEALVEASPAVVGFSCYLWNIKQTLALCEEWKKALPGVIIVLGGPEVSYCPEKILGENLSVDHVLSGEGEESFPGFLRALEQAGWQSLDREPGLTVSGLWGRSRTSSCNAAETVCVGKSEASEGICGSQPAILTGAVPSPLTAGYGEAVKGRMAYIETSRGCPYSCAFCLSGRCGTPRYFPLERVYEDILALANSGARTIKFVDRTFNAKPSHANGILAFILEHYGKEIPAGTCFHFEIAGDILKEETFALLEQLPPGAVQLEIGMQSFCEETLIAIGRKTNTERLKTNIRRLVAMGNMHIHIDLIAGLPLEDLETFKESFNTGYDLGAQMLQLGFLKLLYGSPMRENREQYPCEFDENPPYEVISTPWISPEDLALLECTEDALERVYNCGRFTLTAAYALEVTAQNPFDFYTDLGLAAKAAGLPWNVPLDDYTAFLMDYLGKLPGVDKEILRDNLVRDRLAVNQSGSLPACLIREDENLARILKHLAAQPETARPKASRRGGAILYGAGAVCFTDYVLDEKNPVTGRWALREILLKDIDIDNK